MHRFQPSGVGSEGIINWGGDVLIAGIKMASRSLQKHFKSKVVLLHTRSEAMRGEVIKGWGLLIKGDGHICFIYIYIVYFRCLFNMYWCPQPCFTAEQGCCRRCFFLKTISFCCKNTCSDENSVTSS